MSNRESNLSMLDLSHGLFKIWFNIESLWLNIESSFLEQWFLTFFLPKIIVPCFTPPLL